jgi:hypothetical protein
VQGVYAGLRVGSMLQGALARPALAACRLWPAVLHTAHALQRLCVVSCGAVGVANARIWMWSRSQTSNALCTLLQHMTPTELWKFQVHKF